MPSFDTASIVAGILSALLVGVPELLVYLVGIIVAVTRWNRNGSTFVAIALSVGLLFHLMISVIYQILPVMMNEMDLFSNGNVMWIYWGIAFFSNLIHAGVWGTILVVMFRNQPQPHLNSIEIELPAE